MQVITLLAEQGGRDAAGATGKKPFSFSAGQYLQVVHPDGTIPMSVASGPHRLPEFTLHYRSTPGVAEAALMDELLASGEALKFQGPDGDVYLGNESSTDMLLVAAGTGVSQAISFVDEFLHGDDMHTLTLMTCVASEEDAYFDKLIPDSPRLRRIRISDSNRGETNEGLQWLRRNMGEYRTQRVVLSGSPDFAYAALEAIESAGVNADRVESDVFAYAPRR